VTRKKDALQAEVLPRRSKIREWDPPVFRLLVNMRLKAETEDAVLGLAEEALVKLTIVFVCDFASWLKERG
jgi:hypothetical protein